MRQMHTGFRRSEEIAVDTFCMPNAHGHCITCGDEALPARVLHVDDLGWTVQVEVQGQITEVDVSLMDEVSVGQVLLVHGGVALGTLGIGEWELGIQEQKSDTLNPQIPNSRSLVRLHP